MTGSKRTRTQDDEMRHGYEFGGPIGAIGMTLGLPTLTYFLLFSCNDVSGCPAPILLHPNSFSLENLAHDIGWGGWASIFNWKTFVAILGYYALTLALYALLPATEAYGSELRNGGRLKYRFNAFNTCMVVLAILAVGTCFQGAHFAVWTFITDEYLAIVTSNLIIALILSSYCYLQSLSIHPRRPTIPAMRELALGGTSGNIFYDWFIGRELNPPLWIPGLGYIDIKTYMETRPGLIGWQILNLAFCARQYREYGFITNSMAMVILSQSLYALDACWNEPDILTQIDIVMDGFGFMLAFGDLVWLPFTFSLQTRYLSVYPQELSVVGVVGILLVQLLGYYIFRASNTQKNLFRTRPNNPSIRDLSFIQTGKGTRLLTGGWWGAARHINYLGDWVFSWAYCLPTGIAGYVIHTASDGMSTMAGAYQMASSKKVVVPGEAYGWGMAVTYFYIIYFAVLLVHRQRRDDAKCLRKYGKDWEQYVRRVPSRIIPGIY